MKKICITCFYLFLTLAIAAGGFFLPSALNAYQDGQIFAKIEHTAMESLELTYSSSLLDTLRLLSQKHYFVEYPSAGSKRTDEEIYGIALEIIDQLKANGLLPTDSASGITNYNAELQLAIASEDKEIVNVYNGVNQKIDSDVTDAQSGGNAQTDTQPPDITSAVVWLCSVYFKSGYQIAFWIDDKSGKTVSCSMFTKQSQSLTAIQDESKLHVFASNIAAFLQEYYGMPAKLGPQPAFHSYGSPLFEKNAGIFEVVYTIQLTEENGNLIEMPLRVLPEGLTLN